MALRPDRQRSDLRSCSGMEDAAQSSTDEFAVPAAVMPGGSSAETSHQEEMAEEFSFLEAEPGAQEGQGILETLQDILAK